MRWIHRAMSALRAILRRRQVERELDAELQFHVEQQIAENVEAGMTADEARAAAWRSLGSVTALREECRDALGTAFVDQLGQDVRYCFRTLRRSPGFSVAAILSMALGIGVNTALFSIADGVLLKPLPYRNAERLVRLPEYRADARSAVREPMLSNVTLEAWRRSARALDGLAPYSGRAYTVTRAGDAEYVSAAAVSPELFRILDVSPVAGRFFDASEAIAGADHVTVLGYEY